MRAQKIVMIRPANFGFNEETAISNEFQTNTNSNVTNLAIEEFDDSVKLIKASGIEIEVIQDSKTPVKPDAVFPNNWLQLRWDKKLITFPMATPNRRIERDEEHINYLMNHFQINERVSLENNESDNKILEGTGSLVFDHFNKVGYAAISARTNEVLAKEYIEGLGYEAVLFNTKTVTGNSVYHTNVVIAIAKNYAIVCPDVITEGNTVLSKLMKGRTIISISEEQMNAYCGNGIELENNSGESVFVMSKKAEMSFTELQLAEIKSHSHICSLTIPNIETIGGGSARCMIAENFCA